MDAPLNAAEAASQLSDVWADLHAARDESDKYGKAAASLESVYKTARARALLDPSLDGKNQAQRDAAAHEWPASDDHRGRADAIAESVGMPGTAPETVGDLRWLRDRVSAMAEVSSARAYDQRSRLQGWQVVAAFARAEAQLAPPVEVAP